MNDTELAIQNDAHKKAPYVILLQVFIWLFTVGPVFSKFTGSDPAGNALGQGLSIFLFTVPGMFIIFLSNLYLSFKASLHKYYRAIAIVNFIALALLYKNINW